MTDQPERKREEDAATEQWKQEFMERHGLMALADGGLVKDPNRMVLNFDGTDFLVPKRWEKYFRGDAEDQATTQD